MCKWYKEMDCYLLTDTTPTQKYNFDKIVQRAQLEQSFRNYAAVFDKVKLVISDSQAKEHFLNFPHISIAKKSFEEADLLNLLRNSKSEAVFIGYTNLVDFPISILSKMLQTYNNEMFMGYDSKPSKSHSLSFGIYNKSMIPALEKSHKAVQIQDKKRFKYLSIPESVKAVFL